MLPASSTCSAKGLLKNVMLIFHLRYLRWLDGSSSQGFQAIKKGIRKVGFAPPPPPFPSIGAGIILVWDCCLQCPQLEAADAIHAQGDVGASQAPQRDNMFRLGLHLKNVWSQYVRMFLHLIWLHASMWAGTSSRSTPAGRWTCRRCWPIAWAGLGPKTRDIPRP